MGGVGVTCRKQPAHHRKNTHLFSVPRTFGSAIVQPSIEYGGVLFWLPATDCDRARHGGGEYTQTIIMDVIHVVQQAILTHMSCSVLENVTLFVYVTPRHKTLPPTAAEGSLYPPPLTSIHLEWLSIENNVNRYTTKGS